MLDVLDMTFTLFGLMILVCLCLCVMFMFCAWQLMLNDQEKAIRSTMLEDQTNVIKQMLMVSRR